MQSINKKGFSSILQITIISALTIVCLFLIWGYVKDLTDEFSNQLSPAVDCISQRSEVSRACINGQGIVEVSLNTAVGENTKNLYINLEGESFTCSESCSSCTILESKNQGKKTIYLNQENKKSKNLITSINGCTPQQIQIESC
jgi:hypothetical protein